MLSPRFLKPSSLSGLEACREKWQRQGRSLPHLCHHPHSATLIPSLCSGKPMLKEVFSQEYLWRWRTDRASYYWHVKIWFLCGLNSEWVGEIQKLAAPALVFQARVFSCLHVLKAIVSSLASLWLPASCSPSMYHTLPLHQFPTSVHPSFPQISSCPSLYPLFVQNSNRHT